MSALRAKTGLDPDPIEATIPVLATGQVYSIPSESSSDLMSSLVLYSSNPISGYWWILLLTPIIHSKNSGSLADSNNARVNNWSSDSVAVVSKAQDWLEMDNMYSNMQKSLNPIIDYETKMGFGKGNCFGWVSW